MNDCNSELPSQSTTLKTTKVGNLKVYRVSALVNLTIHVKSGRTHSMLFQFQVLKHFDGGSCHLDALELENSATKELKLTMMLLRLP